MLFFASVTWTIPASYTFNVLYNNVYTKYAIKNASKGDFKITLQLKPQKKTPAHAHIGNSLTLSEKKIQDKIQLLHFEPNLGC